MNDLEESDSSVSGVEMNNGNDPHTPVSSMMDENTTSITPLPLVSRERESLDQNSNSMYSTRFLNGNDKLTIESPRFSTDMLRTNGTIQASDSLLLSPLQLNSPVIEMPHSPFPSLNLLNTPRSGYLISHPQDDIGGDSFVHGTSSLGSEHPSFHDGDGEAGNQLQYPPTPVSSIIPPLFDKLYYSPIFSKGPLFQNQSDRSSEVNLRDMKLKLRNSPFESDYLNLDDLTPIGPNTKSNGSNCSNLSTEQKTTQKAVFHFTENQGEKMLTLRKESNSPIDLDDGSYSDEYESVTENPSQTRHIKQEMRRRSQKRASVEQGPPEVSDIAISSHPCNCKKSRCLKLYCECFSADVFCNGCNCTNCLNNPSHMKEREEAKHLLLERNANAFKPRVVKDSQSKTVNLKGCNCKKTGCLKKYCECFQSGIPCGKNCHCIDCRNTEEAGLFLNKGVKNSDLSIQKISSSEIDEDFCGSS